MIMHAMQSSLLCPFRSLVHKSTLADLLRLQLLVIPHSSQHDHKNAWVTEGCR